MAQSSGEKGWKAFEDNKNRSAVLSAFTDNSTKAIRTLLYDYHRKGLDEMVLSPEKGKSVITKSLGILKQIHDVSPMRLGSARAYTMLAVGMSVSFSLICSTRQG